MVGGRDSVVAARDQGKMEGEVTFDRGGRGICSNAVDYQQGEGTS